METNGSHPQTSEIIVIDGGVNTYSETKSVRPNVSTADQPLMIKHEPNGFSHHVVKDPSATMPSTDSISVGMKDGEDTIHVYPAQPPKTDDESSPDAPVPTKRPRRDYSSTSEEEVEEIPFQQPKFLLQSDVSRSASQHHLTKSRLSQSVVDDEDDEKVRFASPKTYMRCILCIRDHRPCDRRLPHCMRCSSSAECIYPKHVEYRNNTDALKRILGMDLVKRNTTRPSPSESLTSQPKRSLSAPKEPKPVSQLQTIAWEEGDISHSQKKCPPAILNMIRSNYRDFEDTQLALIWKREKTTYLENDREVIYFDEQSDEDVPVARYIYGDSKQFFVAWLPAKDASLPSIPVICKFRVYNNEPNIRRHGRVWRPLRWQSWCPDRPEYHKREILRLICTLSAKQASAVARADVVDLDGNAATSRTLPKRSMRSHIDDESSDGMTDTRQDPKRRKLGLSGSDSRLDRVRGSGERPSTRRSMAIDDLDSALASASKNTRHFVNHVVREPQPKGPNLTVIFKASSGETKGSYPYHECDTAEKLFDVACVAQIAQIEPPATRLLNIQFDGGGEGRIRPDNSSDYDRLFKPEVQKLMATGKDTKASRVIVSPYL